MTFFSENLALYEIMWKKMVQPDRPQKTIHDSCALHIFLLQLSRTKDLYLYPAVIQEYF
jgi:hypothetical protein